MTCFLPPATDKDRIIAKLRLELANALSQDRAPEVIILAAQQEALDAQAALDAIADFEADNEVDLFELEDDEDETI